MKANIFKLAMLELAREGKLSKKNLGTLMIDRALKIRRYLDAKVRN